MIKKLRVKFICVNMLIVSVMLILLFSMTAGFVRANLVSTRTETLSRVAQNPAHMRPVTDSENNNEDELQLQWFLLERMGDGSIRSMSSGGFDLSDTALLDKILAAAEAEPEHTGVLEDYDLRYFRAETLHGQKAAFSDLASERLDMHGFYRASSIVSLLGLVIFFGISVLLAYWVVGPVDRAWREQRQFVADASHELKTPLAVIMANAELLQEPGYDEEKRRGFVDSILTMSQQMRRLVEGLLDLARLDSAQPTAMEEIDFSQLTEDCLLPFEPLYFERGLLLESKIEPELKVRGNEQKLRQCVDILLDNAQKYSLPGKVRLTLRRGGRECELTVANPSQELTKSECKDIFKRFYRRDEARTDSGSYGLGLPIAEGIVALHQGRIDCQWEAGEIRFTVTLPLE